MRWLWCHSDFLSALHVTYGDLANIGNNFDGAMIVEVQLLHNKRCAHGCALLLGIWLVHSIVLPVE